MALGSELEAIVDARTLEIVEHRRRLPKARRRGWLIRRALLAADVTSLCLAFSLAQFLSVRSDRAPDSVNVKGEFLVFFLSLPAWVVVAKMQGLYDRDEERTDHTTADDIVGVIHLVTFGTWIFFAGAWLSRLGHPQILKVVTFWLIAILLMPILRSSARAVCRRQIAYLQNTIIVGADHVGQKLATKLLRHPEYGINLVGFVDDDQKIGNGSSGQVTLLGPLRRLPSLVRALDVERVILAFPGASQAESLDVIRSMKDLDVQVDIVPRLFDVVSPGIGVHTIEGVPLIGLPPPRLSRSSTLLKRVFDVA